MSKETINKINADKSNYVNWHWIINKIIKDQKAVTCITTYQRYDTVFRYHRNLGIKEIKSLQVD